MFAPQDWEDSHTQSEKWIEQHLLLPHEVVGCFLREGETQRMIGCVSCLVSFTMFYNFTTALGLLVNLGSCWFLGLWKRQLVVSSTSSSFCAPALNNKLQFKLSHQMHSHAAVCIHFLLPVLAIRAQKPISNMLYQWDCLATGLKPTATWKMKRQNETYHLRFLTTCPVYLWWNYDDVHLWIYSLSVFVAHTDIKESKNMRCSLSNFLYVKVRARWTIASCCQAAFMAGRSNCTDCNAVDWPWLASKAGCCEFYL